MKTKLLLTLTLGCVFTGFSQIGFEENVVENSGNISLPVEVLSIDIDGDGDMDIVSGSICDDKVAWYENMDGLGTFGSQQVVTTTADGVQAIDAADIDGDNDMDIVALSHNADKVTWYENLDGQGNFSSEQVIVNSILNATVQSSIKLSDFDGDGDLDVLVPYYGSNDKVSWFENLNGDGSSWSESIVTTEVNSPNHVVAADFDGDNDEDILTVSTSDGKLAWYNNTNGLGDFGPQQIIKEEFGINSALAVDVDMDNDLDIIFTMTNDSQINWIKNIDGLGTFAEEQVITINPNLTFGYSIYVEDMDGDGDMDLLSSSRDDDILAWYENTDGLGTFGPRQICSTSLDSPSTIVASDINQDGKIDIVSAAYDNRILWFNNLGVVTNEINGVITLDANFNGCDNEDILLENLLIETTDGMTNNTSTFSLSNGSYKLFTSEGDFTTSIVAPNYYVSNPVSHVSNFTGVGNINTVDFCLQPAGVFNDLQVVIYPLEEARPGFDTSYQVVYKNVGTTTLSGSIDFEYDNTKLQFLSASETVSSQTSNVLTFDFANLYPFESRTINLDFNVFAPPTVEINEILSFTATIDSVFADETEDDNVFNFEQIVIGSYDPNDIQVLEGDQVYIDDIDKYLHYIIRFQNTGTASAINVRVNHILDEKLDFSTMQLESMSHEGRVEIIDGSNIDFIFDNINLPDSTNDEPNSHGFIAFKIKPKQDVAIGDVINGVADIYFDFNLPITTNTVATEIVETLSVNDVISNTYKVYPNPAEIIVTIQSKTNIDVVSVYDINGRLLSTTELPNSTTDYELQVDNLSEGLYFLEIKSGNAVYKHKFIKK